MSLLSFNIDVKSSIDINCDTSKVRDFVGDSNNWKEFSPWIILDEQAKNKISGNGRDVGSILSWQGKYIGEGEIEVTEKNDNAIFYKLRFLKPFKSKAKTWFSFESSGSNTKVTWHMKSSMPIFLIFFKQTFISMISSDYDRGLIMLKSFLEKGSVDSKMEDLGIGETKKQSFIGIKINSCKLSDLPEKMSEIFDKLKELVNQENISNPRFYTIYHHMDIKTMSFGFTTAVSFENCDKVNIVGDMYKGICPEVKTLKVRHTGDWEFLGNAWKYGMVRCFGKHTKYKYNKRSPSFEVYESMDSPKITDVYISVK
ncbi:SRPBCC family protein [Francisella halioticida]|nr:SRPBCC family protein [Francisella halioticida]